MDRLLEGDGASELRAPRGDAFEKVSCRTEPPKPCAKNHREFPGVHVGRQGLTCGGQCHALELRESIGAGLVEGQKASDSEAVSDAWRHQTQSENGDTHQDSRVKTREALFPPKPKELDIATLSGTS